MRDWLSHRAAATPDDLAVIDADTDTRWSYSGLDAAVDETAGRLANLGVDAGDQVGTLLPRTFLGVCLLHAAQRLGVTLVPLNHRLTTEELGAQIDQLELRLVVCNIETEPVAVETIEDVPIASVDEPQWAAVRSFKNVAPAAVTPVEWNQQEPQLIIFTSGSTGRPKPVVLTMKNLLFSAIASAFRLGVEPTDRWLLTLSLYHVGGIAPIFRSTLYGTAVVLRSDFDPGQAADDLDRYDVTVVSLVPTMLKRMLDRRGTLSDSLRVVLLGGAPADDALLQRCQNYSVPVCPTYGMTETASQVATARPADAIDQPGTVGRPLLWSQVTVVGDAGEPVAAGESGELVVSGPTVSPGYYGDVDTEAFGPYGLRTGDIGYQTEDGSLFIINRVDDRITSGGETIDPGTIVSTLTDHEAIAAAAVVGVPDDEWGERVTALIVPATDDLTAEMVDSHCREHLAGFKCPKTIMFGDELPRTASGSVDRPAVREVVTTAETEAAESPTDSTDDSAGAEPPIESADADSVANEADDGGTAISDRQPPSPMSPAEEPPTSSTATPPIPDAEADAVDADGGADSEEVTAGDTPIGDGDAEPTTENAADAEENDPK